MGALAILQIVMQLLPVAAKYGPDVVSSFKALIESLSGGDNLTAEEQVQFEAAWAKMRADLTAVNADWENATR